MATREPDGGPESKRYYDNLQRSIDASVAQDQRNRDAAAKRGGFKAGKATPTKDQRSQLAEARLHARAATSGSTIGEYNNAQRNKNRFIEQARAGRLGEKKKFGDPSGINGVARQRNDNQAKMQAYKDSLKRAQAKTVQKKVPPKAIPFEDRQSGSALRRANPNGAID